MNRNTIAALLVTIAGFASTGIETAQASCPVPNTLANGNVADADQVMGNFNALSTCLNNAGPGGTANAVQYNSGSGTLGGVGPLTNGQLLIGSTGNAPQAAALTAGSGVSITNGPGSITLSATGAAGGAVGSIQYNNGGGTFSGLTLSDGMIAVGAGASYNALTKSSNVLLTAGNLAATTNNASYGGALATVSQSSSKYYFEFQAVTISNANSGIGMATVTASLANYLGSSNLGIGLEPNGGVWLNGAQIGTAAAVPSGTNTVGIAVDLTNKLIWFRTGTSGQWNNSGTADPASGTGGISISALANFTLFPAAIWRENLGTATLALPMPSWLGTAPSGFGAWATGSNVSAVNVSGAASLSNGGVLTSNAVTTQSTPANPTGTINTSAQVMMGLAGSITPGASGRVLFMTSGDGFNTAAVGDGFIVQLRYGTGTAPSNGGAVTGTAVGGAVKGVTAVVSSAQDIPFALQAMVTTLSVGTTYWYDVGVQAIGGGTATIENLSLSAVEM